MKNLIATLALLSALVVATPAFALDLHGARRDGTLGEKADGYVTVLKAGGEAQSLADEVNAKRRAEYARIAAENGQSVDVTAHIAAGEIAKKLPTGARYQGEDGSWKTK